MFSKGQLPVQGIPILRITTNPEQVRPRPITGMHLPREGLIPKVRIQPVEAVPVTADPAHQAGPAQHIIAQVLQDEAAAPTAVQAARAEAAAHTAVRVLQAAVAPTTVPAVLRAEAAAHTAAAAHQAGAVVLTVAAAGARAGAVVPRAVQAGVHQVAAPEDHPGPVHQDQDVKLSFNPGS